MYLKKRKHAPSVGCTHTYFSRMHTYIYEYVHYIYIYIHIYIYIYIYIDICWSCQSAKSSGLTTTNSSVPVQASLVCSVVFLRDNSVQM